MNGEEDRKVNSDTNLVEQEDEEEEEVGTNKRIRLLRPQTTQPKKICAKEERNANFRKVSLILQKSDNDRNPEDTKLLSTYPDIVDEVQQRSKKREAIKKRMEEFEDPDDVLVEKCQLLAQAIAQSQHLVVYTGAGISTAAKIPDYRGPNGIWTRMKEGKEIGDHDLSLAEPTFTHMALYELYRKKILKYVVSQNCDGLHLRSGLPRTALSELHGNMYMEVCKTCKPHREYWRLFDVTESTARYAHKTYRRCYVCNGSLVDTIVHFGERGSLLWPLNWKGACKNAKEATTIICIGSSLKVLKKYPWLWQMEKPVKKRPNLYIINLQWTPKDDCANVKINGKCDTVFKKIMSMLGVAVPHYHKSKDPIFYHFSELNDLELHTNTQPSLIMMKIEDNNYCSSSSIPETVNNNSDNKCYYNNDLNNKKVSMNDQLLVKNKPQICSSLNNLNNVDDLNHHHHHHHHQICDIKKTINSDPHHHHHHHQNNNHGITLNNFVQSYSRTIFEPSLTFLSYYNFLHNKLFPYTDLFLYPYQTSFLYPGLQSIINPIIPSSLIRKEEEEEKEENKVIIPKKNEPLLLSSSEQEIIQPNNNVTSSSCTFCCENYKSFNCMFYQKFEPVFKEQTFRYSKLEKREKPNICICCDYTTEEDDEEFVQSSDKELETNNKDQKNKIQAGWFGKGYRKSIKRFKRKAPNNNNTTVV